jgi:Flp pilus assembly secretin CpaC
MTRSTIATTALVALIVGFVATNRTLATERYVGGMEVISSDATARFVPLVANKAMVFELPRDVKNVLVGSPRIVTALMQSSRRAYLVGLSAGQTNVYYYDAEGRQIAALSVFVTNDAPPSPFIGRTEPQTEVTVFRGATGFNSTLQCTPTNCTAPAQVLPDLPAGYTDQTIRQR